MGAQIRRTSKARSAMDASMLILLFLSALCLSPWVKSMLHRRAAARCTPLTHQLPPGPPATTLVGLILRSLYPRPPDLKRLLHQILTRYGPIVTLRAGCSQPTILIADSRLAHHVLVSNGAASAGRPPDMEPLPLITGVSAADYGPQWRVLRRNLASGILHTSSLRSYAGGRRRVLSSLLEKLGADMESGDGVVTVRNHFLYAMLSLLVDMVFGETQNESVVKATYDTHKVLSSYYNRLAFDLVFQIWQLLLPTSMSILPKVRQTRERIFLPLIRARRDKQWTQRQQQSGETLAPSYVDSLINLELPEREGRKLEDDEIVTFCSEFLSAGAETTAAALEWIMANITQRHHIQKRPFEEMELVAGEEGEVKEEDLEKMEYLNASSDILVEGYLIPKHHTINFMVGSMGLDERLWRQPLEFMPERFLPGGEYKVGEVTSSEDIIKRVRFLSVGPWR